MIFSSHILSEVQNICDQILILSKGHLVAFDTPENLERQMLRSNEISLVTEASPDEALHILCQVEGVTDSQLSAREDGLLQIHLSSDCDDLYRPLPPPLFCLRGAKQGPFGTLFEKGQLGRRVFGADRAKRRPPTGSRGPKGAGKLKIPTGPGELAEF